MADFYNQYGGQYNPYTYTPSPTQQLTNPYSRTYVPPVTQMPQQPVDNLIRVTGIDGAKAYQLPANSTVALFDANNDIMYIKTTDGAGFPSIRAFSFAPLESATTETPTEYVARAEFDELAAQVRGLLNAKQSVRSTDAAAAGE